MAKRYRLFVSEQVWTTIPGLNSKSRAFVREFILGLARHPNRLGDYSEPDDDGRPIQVTVVEGYAVLFWTDHAAAEVKVVEVRLADEPMP